MERLVERHPREVPGGEVHDFVDFFRLYTDAAHHGKEEDLLFETLTEHGFSRDVGPIAVMLEEHRLGRALVRQMADAASAYEGDAGAWSSVRRVALDYIQLIRHHILKEDHALFEMADTALDEPACRKLCDAYDGVCAGRFEGRTLEQLERAGETLAARYRG